MNDPEEFFEHGFQHTSEVDIQLPCLVLALEHEWLHYKAHGKQHHHVGYAPGREWKKIEHQTAGVGCYHHQLEATILTPRPGVFEKMTKLHDRYYDTSAGVMGVSLDALIDYRTSLVSILGVDCNFSYAGFEEAYYPIDIEFVSRLASDELPENLDDLLVWDQAFDRALGVMDRWKLLILAENSD